MHILELSRKPKAELVALVHEQKPYFNWIIGGPEEWSKDELVSYIVRETDLPIEGLPGVTR